jgi:hypothetical protein
MVELVTEEHLTKYIQRDIHSVRNVNKDGIIYEALCEMIVELNPSYKMEKLAETYKEQSGDTNIVNKNKLRKFLHNKFESVIDESVKEIAGVILYNKWTDNWVSASVNGVQETTL